jgi:predicted amidohydrolase
MKTFFIFSGVFVLVLLTAYNIWAEMDRVKEQTTASAISPLYKNGLAYAEFGADSGKGNIIGMQPFLTPANYASGANFKSILRVYFEVLKKENKITPKSVVVLPEYIGTWLVTANEKTEIYKQPTVDAAMTTLVITNLYKFFINYFNAPATDKMKYALFSMKAKHMCEIYEATFSQLAKEYNCVIVAGSIALPDLFINSKGCLEITPNGKIYNTAVVFGPGGKIIPPLVKKIFPVDDEQVFSACGKPDQTPIFSTRAGRMALLICADSWFPDAYSTVAGKADFVVIPSLGGADSVWNAPWNGYNGFKAPADVDTTLYRKITEGDAWIKYSMGRRAPQSKIHNGLNIFFTGDLWDLKPEGRVLVLRDDSLTVLAPAPKQGRIVNLYLP